MRAVHDINGFSANGHHGKADVESLPSTGGKTFGVRIDVDAEWFADAAQDLYPTKGGTALHFLTDYDERLCQKYVAGSVKPSAYFLRTLERGPHGRQWLNAVMRDCAVEWWMDLQRAEDIGRKVLAITSLTQKET